MRGFWDAASIPLDDSNTDAGSHLQKEYATDPMPTISMDVTSILRRIRQRYILLIIPPVPAESAAPSLPQGHVRTQLNFLPRF